MSPRLTTFTPVLNEEFFLPLYLEHTLRFSDQVVISDGGSTDRTLEIAHEYLQRFPEQLTLIHHEQTGAPYTLGWNEDRCRNGLLNAADGDYLLWLDVDELLSDNFTEVLPQLLDPQFCGFYCFSFMAFWGNLHTQRTNDKNDPGRWECCLTRMWRNRPEVRYNNAATHCTLMSEGFPQWQIPTQQVPGVTMFHLHYAGLTPLKAGDNRRGDVGDHDGTGYCDWEHLNREIDYGYRLQTRSYAGPYPSLLHEKGFV